MHFIIGSASLPANIRNAALYITYNLIMLTLVHIT